MVSGRASEQQVVPWCGPGSQADIRCTKAGNTCQGLIDVCYQKIKIIAPLIDGPRSSRFCGT